MIMGTVSAEAGLNQPSHSTTEPASGNLVTFSWHLKQNGHPDETIRSYTRTLLMVARLCNIDNPEEVKAAIANQSTWCTNTKRRIVDVYTSYLKFQDKTWKKPRYIPDRKIPFIPLETEIDALIAGAVTFRTGTYLQILKDTAMRYGEAARLEWTDIDLQRRTITVNHPEKHSNSRIIPISNSLCDLINKLPRTADDKRLFTISKHGLRLSFEHTRKQVAEKTNNPRIKAIHQHTFRHWKATMEYHRCKDLMEVAALLGHKSILNTQLYIRLEKALFNVQSDDFYSQTATTVEEARALIEAGFTKEDEIDGTHIYKKRK